MPMRCEDSTAQWCKQFNRGRNMNKDQVKGRVEEIAGEAKKVTGKVVGNKNLEQKGRVEEAAGKARATYGDVKNEIRKGS